METADLKKNLMGSGALSYCINDLRIPPDEIARILADQPDHRKAETLQELAKNGHRWTDEELADYRDEESTPPAIMPICGSNIETRPVEWLWQDVLVRGALNSIQGIAGIGKTFMLCAVVAAVSKGDHLQATNGNTERVDIGNVLYISGDDDPSTTLVPRMNDLDAKVCNVYFSPDGLLPAIGSPELESLFEQTKPSLCVLDTLQHFTPPKTDFNSANSMANSLQPLRRLAEKYNTCVVVIQHISKVAASGNGGDSVNFGIGSSSINGIFRSVWTLGRLKDEEGKPTSTRVLAPSKTNLVPGDPPCILFDLTPEHGFQWAGIDGDITAEALYDPARKPAQRAAPAREYAEEFLRDMLADGKMRVKDIEAEAEACGIAVKTTLRYARENIGVRTTRENDGSGKLIGYWHLDHESPLTIRDGQDGQDGQDGGQYDHVDHVDHVDIGGHVDGQDPVYTPIEVEDLPWNA